jgi:1,2-diacylglycerol 3-beta-galactosyltransferase
MPHILFLMSDTGGGHRAACRAIEAALQERHPSQFTVELVDLWKDYTTFPFNTIPQSASRWIDMHSSSFSTAYWVWDRLFRNRSLSRLYCELMYPRMKRLYAEHAADIVVCVHAAFVRPAVYALRKARIDKPFITVITDYAWPTVLWYDNKVDRCLVPTQPARERGLSLGMNPSQIVLTGAPIHPKFSKLSLSKREARTQLGWDQDNKMILIAGGGDGNGPLVETARAIDERQLDCQLVVVAGRNQALRAALEAVPWKRPVLVYGFVDNMEMFMRAADLIITKAGPATITEAALLGLPIVLNGAIQYQESPNVDYVVKHEAGVYAPGPERTADSVEQVLKDEGAALDRLARGATRLAQPDAIWNIADEIWAYAEGTRHTDAAVSART